MPRGVYPRKQGLPRKRSARPVMERIYERLDRSGSCWLWLGYVDRLGYGTMSLTGRKGRRGYVHRVAYETLVGPIPKGLVLDHLCRVHNCVNPDHLEPVTSAENIRRGTSPRIVDHFMERCANGHPASEAYRRKSTGGVVFCRACRREERRRRYWADAEYRKEQLRRRAAYYERARVAADRS